MALPGLSVVPPQRHGENTLQRQTQCQQGRDPSTPHDAALCAASCSAQDDNLENQSAAGSTPARLPL
jgi:hypothetical protein